MEVLIIGKPTINVYLPLQEYPQEGDIFTITGKNESLGGVGAVSACLLAKWGNKPYFTGVLGNDAYGEKIRNTFSEYKVNTKYLETTFDKGTTTNYFILNVKTGNVTKILYNDPNVELQKFKYDFQPDWAIMDGTDTAGAMALLNNDGKVKTVFYARKADQNTLALAKRCHYVVCSQAFVEVLTKSKISEEQATEEYVDMYQKLVDTVGSSNYIVLLNNKKILYCEENKVKMLPEMKINHADVSSFESVFTGAFTYAMMNNVTLDESVKFANTAAAISISKIGEEPSIPTLDEVLTNSGLRDRFKNTQVVNQTVEPSVQEQVAQQQVVQQPQVQTEATVSAFNQQPVVNQAVEQVIQEHAQEQVVQEQVVQQPPVQAEVVNQAPQPESNIFG